MSHLAPPGFFWRLQLNSAVAQKYREYNKVRDILSGKTKPQGPSSPLQNESRKRKHEYHAETPSKRLANETPSKPSNQPPIVDQYDSPSIIRKLFTPIQNKVIGPTPQKDGQVLGLFDLLSDGETPKTDADSAKQGASNVQATPSKSRNHTDNLPDTINRHSRTPTSSGKRFMLDSFATPLKRRHPNEQGGKTPSSISKLHFSTPSFLRRDSQRTTLPAIEEDSDGEPQSPQMPRLPQKPLVRGLSSILASLRQMGEEAADDDLDALHEIESGGTSQIQHANAKTNAATVLVEDSQPRLLGGFDDEGMYDSEPEEQLGRDGQPLPVWKKKGQKRSTRKVNIKPVRSKLRQTQPQPHYQAPIPTDDAAAPPDLDADITPPEDLIPAHPDGFHPDARNFPSDDDSSNASTEYTASEGGTRRPRPKTRAKPKRTAAGAIRKVGATAHANFKRLKLRNTGAKGGPGHGSRFRRRR